MVTLAACRHAPPVVAPTPQAGSAAGSGSARIPGHMEGTENLTGEENEENETACGSERWT